jgi:hypothetical protein
MVWQVIVSGLVGWDLATGSVCCLAGGLFFRALLFLFLGAVSSTSCCNDVTNQPWPSWIPSDCRENGSEQRQTQNLSEFVGPSKVSTLQQRLQYLPLA